MDCFFCKSPAAHPATGSEITFIRGGLTPEASASPNLSPAAPRALTARSSVLACASCTREFWTWFRQHMRRWSRPGTPDFYAAAARSLTAQAGGETLPPCPRSPS